MKIQIHKTKLNSNSAPCIRFTSFLTGTYLFHSITLTVNLPFVVILTTGTAFLVLQGFHFFDAFITSLIR